MADVKLRFGVMCHGTMLRAWQARCLRQLAQVPGVEPALLIVDGAPSPPPARPSVWRGLKNLLTGRSTLWDLWGPRLVRRMASRRLVDVGPELAGVERIECRAAPDAAGRLVLPEEDVRRIREHGLAFILRFGFGMIGGAVLEAAEHGVWSFRHADPPPWRQGPPAFWETYARAGAVETSLDRLTDRPDRRIVLHRGSVRAEAGWAGYVATCDKLAWAAARWPARTCGGLLAGKVPCHSQQQPQALDGRGEPTPWQALRFVLRCVAGELGVKLRWIFREEQWNVGFSPTPIHRLLEGAEPTDVRWYPPMGRNEFLADPIALSTNGRTTVLAEHFDYRTRKGRVMSLTLEQGRPSGPLAEAIEEPWHLAYPYLVQDESGLYCIPEGSAGGQVWAYRARRFPDDWQRVGPLLADARVADPTVFRHEGRWWMLGMMTGEYAEQGYAELHAWHAEHLLGPWTAHACNPVKTDVRSSRPAGPVFRHAGRLFRPAQDCGGYYGGALVINELTRLTPAAFEERTVTRLAPPRHWPYRAGLHTLCPVEGGVVLDARRMVFVPRCCKERLRALLLRKWPET